MTTLDIRTPTALRDPRRFAVPQAPQREAQEQPLGNTLAAIIQTVAKAVPEPAFVRACPADAGLAFHPRSLLALLTYYYALEVYSSEDIEDAMRRDADFRRVCAGEFPDARTLRRFRRQNRDLLEHCLSCALQWVALEDGRPRNDLDAIRDARDRVQTAVLMDME